eukprot:CAMPEP_0178943842 /NCGR_PEP_ID=MMETSP0789-20121207/2813_1 /TAXON_ID=3005 /ORGANISM="Rhizosolenia setigera, Strain CCMP 1694" /LENGTH=492 /DNA_ID=CAMNT_0020623485 /DNA_START=84 /DNA_END=1562 /DNA_ORIENTATION=+
MHKENRSNLRRILSEKGHANSLVYIKGGSNPERFDSDHEPIFRQESYFHYLFGVKEPDFEAVIDTRDGTTTIAIPRLPPSYATFMGRMKSLSEFRDLYYVDNSIYTDEVEAYLMKKVSADEEVKILLLRGVNSDSGNMYEPPEFRHKLLRDVSDTDILFPILCNCRVIKSKQEKELLRHVTKVTSQAHVFVMRNIKIGMAEYQLESLFRHYCYFNFGHRHTSYTSICGCGPNSAVLHYGHAGAPNDAILSDGDMILLDMGSEYHCYASDVTCSYPVNGIFTEEQEILYNGVLNAQKAVMQMLRPGVSWVACHKAAEKQILLALVKVGIVNIPSNNEDILDELVDKRLGAVFMPHGLGHFIGIDTHDVGGYLEGYPERSLLAGLKSLRTARDMEENMCVTIEPGCYFIDHLIYEALNNSDLSEYLVEEKLEKFRRFGGIRLEDVVLVTKDGCQNLTCCPRTIEEVKDVLNGKKWPPLKDGTPELKRKFLCDPN